MQLFTLQYEMFVDKYARQRHRNPSYELQTFYGQLQHLFIIHFETVCPGLRLQEPTTIIMAAIWTCILDDANTIPVEVLDIHDYTKQGALHIVDVTSIQCLVARVKDDTQWSILDRSGALARAVHIDDKDE